MIADKTCMNFKGKIEFMIAEKKDHSMTDRAYGKDL